MLEQNVPNYVKLVNRTPLPKIALCRQWFPRPRIDDPAAAVHEAMKADCVAKVKPGMSIAVTAGSRGIADFAPLVAAIVAEIRARGATPFVVPAMGSHGGATAEGQTALLAKLGVTEETVGAPIRSSMETVEVGTLDDGSSVRIDRIAHEADGIVAFNRIKPHTSFRAPNESGLAKMLAIGLGKQSGAEVCHARGAEMLPVYVDWMARMKLERCKILFGIGTIENAYDELARVVALDSVGLMEAEQPLLREAAANMPRLPVGTMDTPTPEGDLDVLVVDTMGKEYSGTGMDPNITHRFTTPSMKPTLHISRIAVLNLSPRSNGNAVGVARAEVATERLAAAFDRELVYANAITSTNLIQGQVPMIMPDDKTAIQTVVKSCGAVDITRPRLLRIQNTLHLEYFYASEAMLPEIEARENAEIIGAPEEMRFEDGHIVNPWPDAHA